MPNKAARISESNAGKLGPLSNFDLHCKGVLKHCVF